MTEKQGIVILGTSPSHGTIIESAVKRGLFTVVFDQKPPEISKKAMEKIIYEPFSLVDQAGNIIKWVVENEEKYNLRGVLTNTTLDKAWYTLDKIREALSIEPLNVGNILDKARAKNFVEEVGIKVPQTIAHGRDAVIKPTVDATGGRLVQRFKGEYIIEGFVLGVEYTVDGIIDRRGFPQVCSVAEKEGPMFGVTEKMTFVDTHTHCDEVRRAGYETMRAFDVYRTLFSVDVIWDVIGIRPYVIDVGLLPDRGILAAWKLLGGVDAEGLVIDVAMGEIVNARSQLIKSGAYIRHDIESSEFCNG